MTSQLRQSHLEVDLHVSRQHASNRLELLQRVKLLFKLQLVSGSKPKKKLNMSIQQLLQLRIQRPRRLITALQVTISKRMSSRY